MPRQSDSGTDPSPILEGDVLIVPNADSTFTVFGALKDIAGSVPVNPQALQAVLAAFGRSGLKSADLGQRVFEMRPQDLAWFDAARKMQAGDGYVHGSLLNDKGHISRNIAIKEVSPKSAPMIDPMALVVASQLASIQTQLNRIEDRLEDVTFTVKRGVELIERDQTAEAAAAVTVTNEVFLTMTRTGIVGTVDWSRIANAEQPILKRHIATVKELEELQANFQLDGSFRNDRKVSKLVDADRWTNLLAQETMLRQAGLQWTAVYAARKQEEGIDDCEALQEIYRRHAELSRRADRAARGLLETAKSAPATQPRHRLEQLFTQGLYVGGRRDAAAIEAIENLRKKVISTAKRAPSIAILPPGKPTLRLIA